MLYFEIKCEAFFSDNCINSFSLCVWDGVGEGLEMLSHLPLPMPWITV